MSNNGKGDTPRPFSVDQETFSNNWDRIFKKSQDPDPTYVKVLESGIFWELFPELTGMWEEDKQLWSTVLLNMKK
jgi:hypothetical protein